MNRLKFMFIAGEPSGDALAAELVLALKAQVVGDNPSHPGPTFAPRLFGAGGQRLREAGMDTVVDMTAHSVIGFSDVFKKILTFRRFFRRLCKLAAERQPDVVVCVDFSGFNRRLGHAIRRSVPSRGAGFSNWSPKIVQYVSPQVWASRPGRALRMREDFDLVLSIFPFETEWYARNAPGLPVEFVGHPMLDRYADLLKQRPEPRPLQENSVLLLPGSRRAELKRHLPALSGALQIIRSQFPQIAATMVLPNDVLLDLAKTIGIPTGTQIRIGGLPEALMGSDLAMASTGTVTMECALFGVPTIALYKTSWSTYQIGRRIVSVPFLAMPNILARESIFPEFIQEAAIARSIGECAVALLKDRERRGQIREKLSQVVGTLGGPGASRRAARAVLDVLKK